MKIKKPGKLSKKAVKAATNLDYLDPKYMAAAKKRQKIRERVCGRPSRPES